MSVITTVIFFGLLFLAIRQHEKHSEFKEEQAQEMYRMRQEELEIMRKVLEELKEIKEKTTGTEWLLEKVTEKWR